MEKIINNSIIVIIVLVIALLLFNGLDNELGTKETTTEFVTITDTYTRTVKSGNATIKKYYITFETENGEETISITHSTYEDIEINNEIEITKTTIKTKWTKETHVLYSIN